MLTIWEGIQWYLVCGTIWATLLAVFKRPQESTQLGIGFWLWPVGLLGTLWGIVGGLAYVAVVAAAAPFALLQKAVEPKERKY